MSKKIPNGNAARIASSEDLAAEVRAARRARGLTQEEVAFTAGVGRRFVVELEAGKPTLRLGHVLRVLNALGVELMLAAR